MLSLPARGARIEIGDKVHHHERAKSLPARGARIEMPSTGCMGFCTTTSLPARGARIEIIATVAEVADDVVAPRKGSAD